MTIHIIVNLFWRQRELYYHQPPTGITIQINCSRRHATQTNPNFATQQRMARFIHLIYQCTLLYSAYHHTWHTRWVAIIAAINHESYNSRIPDVVVLYKWQDGSRWIGGCRVYHWKHKERESGCYGDRCNHVWSRQNKENFSSSSCILTTSLFPLLAMYIHILASPNDRNTCTQSRDHQ